ncbi:CHAP domain-containing protein [Streptococcus pantholopis]|uniref:Immunogenic secreted protein n=1 Tax=Streptococcus pantholopis TaxID=1811193 RepID=A0A172Q946_9STRE|nr:CHAP domain-containing protein [Streptococcus pantholopis]AND80009.1 immunogenic secreted protein [Streptococcus pantholopis]
MSYKRKLLALLTISGLILSEASGLTQVSSIIADDTPAETTTTTTTTTEEDTAEEEAATDPDTDADASEDDAGGAETDTAPSAEQAPGSDTTESTTTTTTTETTTSATTAAEKETAPSTNSGAAKTEKKSGSQSASDKASAAGKEAAANPLGGNPLSSFGLPFLSDSSEIADATTTNRAYVEHWTGDDAYTHNLLSHRYGITAEQLDGYLASTGVAYDKNRINGEKLLEWEEASGLDVRAIVAIAMAESSLGSAGVAALPGSNVFGYGAFDSNPENAANYNDDKAVRELTKVTIIQNKNTTFKRQDDKAKKLALGQLDTVADGGVYFTDTSGTGKKRAEIMEDLDEWIDKHGGTPEIPAELRNISGVTYAEIPAGYSISEAVNASGYIAASYPWGQCTWYVFNRAEELGYRFDAYMGNGGDWQHKSGYVTTHQPEVGYAVSFAPGQAGADGTYGHVAIVEEVKEDGSILISESNALGLGVISYRTFSAAQAKQLTYVVGQKD